MEQAEEYRSQSRGEASGGGRVPPHSLDAERAVLGGILLENGALNLVTQILSPDDYYSRANSLIFEGMTELFRRGQPVDTITLRAWLNETSTTSSS
jgi:replicative DNA helicase